MRLAAFLTSLCCLLVATLVHSVAGLVAALVLAALGNATAGPAASSLLRSHVDPSKEGLSYGIVFSGASSGALLAGLALPGIAMPFGWRWAFVATAALAVLATVVAPGGRELQPEAGQRARAPVGVTPIHTLTLAAFFASAAGTGLVSFIIVYAIHSGITEAAAGLLLAALSLAATVGRVALGALGDRQGRDPLRLLTIVLAIGTIGYIPLATGIPELVAIGALLAGGPGWMWPGSLAFVAVRHAPAAPAWAVGVLLSGLFAGAAVGPFVIGQLFASGDQRSAWAICCTCSVIAVVLLIVFMRRHPTPGASMRAATE